MINLNLPLVDLHRHLDGNILPAIVWKLANKHNIQLPGNSLSEFTKHAQVQGQTSDLLAFLTKLDYGVSVLADYEAIYQVAYDNMRDAKEQGLDYVELRFSPYYMAMNFNLDMAEVVKTVISATQQGANDFHIKHNLIGILSRTFGVDTCYKELDAILQHKDNICALDLAGDELNFPAEQFVEHFKLARDAGLNITVHAGEAAGPESIWNAIKLLGATRIGHGVAAIKDAGLRDYMIKHDIAIESCPTSNYQTATISDLHKHPLKSFFEQGLLVCVNTDDPAVSAIDIKHEYQLLADVLSFNQSQIEQIQLNGVKAAFLTASEKDQLLNVKR